MAAAGLEISALSAKSLDVLHGPPQFGEVAWQSQPGSCFRYSPDGNTYMVCGPKSVSIGNSDDGSEQASFPLQTPATMAAFSPSGSYIITHEKVSNEGAAHKNLNVWRTSDGSLVAAFHKKNITTETWPAIQFDNQEQFLFFLVKDALVVYDIESDFSKAAYKVTLEGVAQFAMSPTKKKVFAAFVPEGRGNKPAVFACQEWAKGGASVNRKQFFRAQRCRLLWNSTGSHVLGHTSCDFDATNQSYFGESRLYLMSSDGNLDMQVTMDNECSIQDAAWSPDGKFFVALGGISPAIGVLFDCKGKALYKLAEGAYNQISWNPHSRFVLLAGFGNMPGDIRLFDKKSDNACKPMGGCRSQCSVLVEWSPCGRFFMTAAVAPRMRVDNRVTVFTYYGTEVATVPYDELFDARWRPRPQADYPDRGQSPERLKAVAESRKQGVNLTAAPKADGYVPPHLRGQGGRPRVEGFDADEAAGRIRQAFANRVKQVEGAENLQSKPKNKNAKKRAGKAKKAQEGKSDDGAVLEAPEAAPETQAAEPAAAPDPADAAKRLRNLRKKLAKIDVAKEKVSKGEALTPEQEASVANEGDVRDEMRALGATDV